MPDITRRVYLANLEAEVDVLTPRQAGLPALVTVTLTDKSGSDVLVNDITAVSLAIEALTRYGREELGITGIAVRKR